MFLNKISEVLHPNVNKKNECAKDPVAGRVSNNEYSDEITWTYCTVQPVHNLGSVAATCVPYKTYRIVNLI